MKTFKPFVVRLKGERNTREMSFATRKEARQNFVNMALMFRGNSSGILELGQNEKPSQHGYKIFFRKFVSVNL